MLKQLFRSFKKNKNSDPDKKIKEFYDLTKHGNEHLDFDFSSFETPESWKKIQYKTYPEAKQIPLKPCSINNSSLSNSLSKRNSVRKYSKNPVEFEKLSALLQNSIGRHELGDPQKKYRRNYPSAGARFPTESYLILQNVTGVEPGIYHYNAVDNTIELLKPIPSEKIVNQLFYKMLNIEDANYIILNSCIQRLSHKYELNAYRYALIECGHIAQNLSLVACALNLDTLMMGGYYNDGIGNLLETTEEEQTNYVIAFGYGE